MNKFQGDWSTYEDFCADFTDWDYVDKKRVQRPPSSEPGLPTEDEIIVARCDEDSYEGSCFVYFKRDGKVYEEELSHCSCNCYRDDQNWRALTPITREYLDQRREPYQVTSREWAEIKNAVFPTLPEIVA